MRNLCNAYFFLVSFLILSITVHSQNSIILEDNLQGSTIGTQVGGIFTSEGYLPGAGENHILYDIPVQIENGYVEVQVKGFNFNDFPEVNVSNPSFETSFMILYDGRGIPEPIGYFLDYRNNYFRWDVTYRSEKYESPGVGNRWKGKIHIAEDSPERLNSTYAVYPYVEEYTADWGIEPNGIYSYWDPNQWYTIKVEWDNDSKNYRFYRDGELVWASNLDSGVPITDNSPYPLTSPWPWLPIDFKIHLGSGPDRYSSKMPNMVYRNFKVVSTGGISASAPVIVSSPITTAAVGELYSYDVNASGNPTPTYSLTESPSGMTINSSTGLIEWTPGSNGSFNVTVVASNGINPDNSQSFTITVVESQSNGCPTNLISYWKLDESSGSSYTDYIGSNNASSTDVPTPSAGRVNGAQIFNGSSNGIVAGSLSEYDFSSNTSFSFEAWIKHTSGTFTDEEIIIERKSSTGALAVNLKFDGTTSAVFSVRDNLSDIYWVAGNSNLYDDNWHHVVGVRDGINKKLMIFVDGKLENEISAPHAGSFESPSTGISIGWRSSISVDFFNGAIDEVAIYNKALTPSEIFQHYINGLKNFGYEQCQVLADFTVILQGPYIAQSTTPPFMYTTLLSDNHLPILQPYSISPWNYTGDEKVHENFFVGKSSIVDWILVELRDKDDPSIIKCARAAFLKDDGKIVDLDGISYLGFPIDPDDYHIAIKHRNHLGIMNELPAINFKNSPEIASYDFTSSAVLGGLLSVKNLGNGKFGMISGDANANGQIQNNDSESFWKTQNGQAGYKSGDFNLNGQVQNNDNEDFWKPNNGLGTQIPFQ